MGKSNVPLLDNSHTFFSLFAWAKAQPRLQIFGWALDPVDAWQLAGSLVVVVIVSLVVYFFFRTSLGTAMRATGDNPDMIRSLGVAARLFGALYEAGVNVRMIDQGSSEMNIIVGIENDDLNTAVKAIYHAFA